MTGRLMFVHAHPDDESSKGAATVARYADAGHHVALVTCTDGGAGDVLNPHHGPVDPADMIAIRRLELKAAVDILGFTATYDLGYPDSGWHEDPADVPEGTFARAPLDEAGARLAAIVRAERPHVVVTYPEDGGYPHPDHVMTYAVTIRALELARQPGPGGDAWDVPKVYVNGGFSREGVMAIHAALVDRGLDSPYGDWLERHEGRPEQRCDARIEIGAWLDRRDRALLAHATQIDPDGWWFAIPRDVVLATFPYDCFQIHSSRVGRPEPEEDLLAGIDPG